MSNGIAAWTRGPGGLVQRCIMCDLRVRAACMRAMRQGPNAPLVYKKFIPKLSTIPEEDESPADLSNAKSS